MKYIMLECQCGQITQQVPIIFPSWMVHSIIYKHMIEVLKEHNRNEFCILSAGDITIEEPEVSGRSDTLGVVSSDEDNETIAMYDYLHGIKS